jgi:hypothetical protein
METNSHEIIIQNLEKQLTERLEKLWRIFSWSSRIIISIIGGVIALEKINGMPLTTTERIILSLVILMLSCYSYLWIKENLDNEKKIRGELHSIMSKKFNYDKLRDLDPTHPKYGGFKEIILAIGFVGIIATWSSSLQ